MPASPQTSATVAELRQDLGVVAYERLLGSADAGYVGLQAMPIFNSAVASAKFPYIPADVGLKAVDDARAATGDYNEVDWRFGMKAFETEDRGLISRLDDRLLALYGGRLPLEQSTNSILVDQILLAYERRVAALAEAGGAAASVAVPWTNPATAKPKEDVDTGKLAMRSASGLLPNAGILSLTAFMAALRTAEFKEATKYTSSPAEIGGFEAQRAALAAHLGLPQLHVAGAVRDSAQKGKSMVIADVWNAAYLHLLHVSAGGESVLEPCWGRTILWTGGASGMLMVEIYRDEARRSDVIRIRNDYCLFEQYASAKYTLGGLV